MQSGDNDRAGWPSLDDLEVAWREELLERLPIGVRALLSSGRFVAVEDGSAVMYLPNEPHVRACEGFLSEVEALLDSRFGVAVPVRLVADGGSNHRSYYAHSQQLTSSLSVQTEGPALRRGPNRRVQAVKDAHHISPVRRRPHTRARGSHIPRDPSLL